jgi:hypothetical protein
MDTVIEILFWLAPFFGVLGMLGFIADQLAEHFPEAE